MLTENDIILVIPNGRDNNNNSFFQQSVELFAVPILLIQRCSSQSMV